MTEQLKLNITALNHNFFVFIPFFNYHLYLHLVKADKQHSGLYETEKFIPVFSPGSHVCGFRSDQIQGH